MKATTVREVKRFAEDQGKTLDEVGREWDMLCFMGQWENDDAEVLVPDGMPVAGIVVHGVKVYY